jgi:hypothetical protein
VVKLLTTLYKELNTCLENPREVTPEKLEQLMNKLNKINAYVSPPERNLLNCLRTIKASIADPLNPFSRRQFEEEKPLFTELPGALSNIVNGLIKLYQQIDRNQEPQALYQNIKALDTDASNCPKVTIQAALDGISNER